MPTTNVAFINGPMHGQFRTLNHEPPTLLRFTVLRDIDVGDWLAEEPIPEVPEIAVYTKGPIERAPKPMRGMLGVYYFSRYEAIPNVENEE